MIHQGRVIDLFKEWDTDGDGTIGPKEFERALIALGLVPNRDDARKLFELLDQDESGAVSVEELIRLKSAIEAAKRGRGRSVRAAAARRRQARAATRRRGRAARRGDETSSSGKCAET